MGRVHIKRAGILFLLITAAVLSSASSSWTYPLVKTIADQNSPRNGETVTVDVNVDLSGGTDQLGTYSFDITWDHTVLSYQGISGGTTPGFETLNKNDSGIDTGTLSINHFYTTGASGDVNVAQITFTAIGDPETSSSVNVAVQALNAATTFADLTGDIDTSFDTITISNYTGPVIESVVIDPNSGTVGPGQAVDITVTAQGNQTGLTPSNATFLGHQVPLADQSDGTYTGSYTIVSGDHAETFDPGALFTEDFDSGTFPQWYAVDGSIIPTDDAKYGEMAVSSDVQGASITVLQKRFNIPRNEFTVSYYFKVSPDFVMADGEKMYVSMVTGTGGPLYAVRLRREGSAYQLNITRGAFIADVGPWQTIERGEWNWIKVHYRNATDGVAEWWLNGATGGSYTGDTSGTPMTIYNALYVGGIPSTTTGLVFIDHMQLTVTDHSEPGFAEATNITLTDTAYGLTSPPASSSGSTLIIVDEPTAPVIASVVISPDTGTIGVGGQVTVTATEAEGMTGLTASAVINGVGISLNDQGNGSYQGVYTVVEGDPDASNIEASNVVLTGTSGSSQPASSAGSSLVIDANTPVISSVVVSPNTGIITPGDSLIITVTAQDAETGLISSDATVNSRSVAISELGDGVYRGTYVASSEDETGVVLEATGITLADQAGNVSDSAASSGSTVIIAIPSLMVISPNGGEQLPAGSVQPVVWQSQNIQELHIEYSSDNGETWSTVADAVDAANGTYQWQVPENISSSGLIRITSVSSSDITDSSDDTFEIISLPTELEHFAVEVTNTGSNAILLIPSESIPEIDGVPVAVGDEIAVLTPRGRIAGAGIWTGANLAITVWGDDVNEEGVAGFQVGEAFSYSIWDASEDQEHDMAATYQSGTGTFMPNGVSITSSLFTLTPADYIIPLTAGWNQISAPYSPGNPSIDAMMFTIRQNLVIVKDGAGDVYWPEFGVNQIGDWSVSDGYQIKLSEADTLEIRGSLVAPETITYDLPAGWSLISYIGPDGMAPATAFGDIVDSIFMVKDALGQVFWPQYDIDNMLAMTRGMGYWIKLNEPANFSYPAGAAKIAVEHPEPLLLSDFTVLQPTNTSATYLLEADVSDISTTALLSSGDEIGMFDSAGNCVGAGVWSGDRIAVSVWGDDELTGVQDGLKVGEPVQMVLWDKETATQYKLNIGGVSEAVVFEPNGAERITFTVQQTSLEHKGTAVPEQFALMQNFPNPFNPVTTIEYSVPYETHVHLAVYTVSGQHIATLKNGMQQAGNYAVTWNASDFPSGMYLCRFISADTVQTTKLLLLK